MKLYNTNISNFSSRCRIEIYEKNAPVEIVPIPGGNLKSPEYLKIYPLGKTPALETNGQIIGESEVIAEYIEEKFPDPPLLPEAPEDRARSRGISRFHDLYLEPPLRAAAPQVWAKERDRGFIAEKLAEVKLRFDQLEAMLSPGPYAIGDVFTLGDCALAPTIFFAFWLARRLGAPPPTEGRPKLAAWWEKVQQRPSVAKVLAEQEEALKAFEEARRR